MFQSILARQKTLDQLLGRVFVRLCPVFGDFLIFFDFLVFGGVDAVMVFGRWRDGVGEVMVLGRWSGGGPSLSIIGAGLGPGCLA